MGKVQYYYNPESCDYEPIRPTKIQILKRGFVLMVLALSLASGAVFMLSRSYPNPDEIKLTGEKETLQLQWDILENEMAHFNSLIEALWVHDEEMRNILELDSLPPEVRSAGFGGSNLLIDLERERLIYRGKIMEAYQRIKKIKAMLNVQEASFDTLMSHAVERDKFWSSIPAIQPVENKDLRRLSTVYGMRLHPIYKRYMSHKGFDFMGHVGVPIYATGDGRVSLAQMTHGGYGNLVEISHGYGYKTRYAHLSTFNVSPGQMVKRGELIGFMGNSGRSAGPHLHYEVLKNSVQVNPIGFFERDLSSDHFARLLEKAKQPTIPLD